VIAVSFLMLPSVTLKRGSSGYILTFVCALASFAVIDEVGKRNYFAGLALAAALVALAIYFYLYGLSGAEGDDSARSTGKSP
jgi:phosphatidylserine synthase